MKLTVILRYTAMVVAGFLGTATGTATASGSQSPQPDTPADTIRTEEDYTQLEDLVVVQRQKLVQSDGAKLTYNVSEDPESGSSNLLDILRKVPGVSVDGEENVKVNGQSSFKVLLNGREDPMLKGDLKNILKSLPAASIKKIEVISEPGAKYESEGIGGILNIITDSSRSLSGFMTQASAWVNGYQAGGYVNGRTKLNKVMLDATVNYNNGKVWPRRNTSTRELEYLGNSPYSGQTIEQSAKGGWDYTGARLGMSWEPDTLNLFTFSANYGYNTWGGSGNDTRTMWRRDLTREWSLYRDFSYDGVYTGVGVQASYQHNFGREGHALVISYGYDYAHQKKHESYSLEYLAGTGSDSPFSMTRGNSDYSSHVVQVDYTNRLGKRHLLEAGAKMNLNDNGAFSENLYGPSQEEAQIFSPATVKMNQLKDIYAVYGSYTGNFAKWSVKGGLRYEHTRMGSRYHIGDYTDFTKHLNDIVPNAAISYNIAAATNIRLAYQMRISRPQLYQVNPFVEAVTPGQISYGNPDIRSEKGHTFSLAYSNYEGKLSGTAKLLYRYVANGVTDIMFMKNDILNITYANSGNSHMAMLELNADWSITPSLQWSAYASGNYVHMRAESELLKAKSHGWQANVNTNLTYTLPCRMRLSAGGGFWSPWIDLNSRGTSNGYYYNIGASRSWLKDDALTVQVNATSFLPAHRTNSYKQQDSSVIFRYTGRFSQWNVGMSISFRFGGLKSGLKKTSANIEKEESGSGNSGQKGNK